MGITKYSIGKDVNRSKQPSVAYYNKLNEQDIPRYLEFKSTQFAI